MALKHSTYKIIAFSVPYFHRYRKKEIKGRLPLNPSTVSQNWRSDLNSMTYLFVIQGQIKRFFLWSVKSIYFCFLCWWFNISENNLESFYVLLIHISQHYAQNQTDENVYFLYKMFPERKVGCKTHVNP